MLQGGIMIVDISYISAHDFNMKTHKVSVTEDNRVNFDYVTTVFNAKVKRRYILVKYLLFLFFLIF